MKLLKSLTLAIAISTAFSALAQAGIKGIFSTSRILTPPVAVSMGSQDGVTEEEARLKSKSTAEHYARMMTDYRSSDAEQYPYAEMLKAIGSPCASSSALQMEGQVITYDLYTSLVDGNTYVQAVLTFKYKCPEMSRP